MSMNDKGRSGQSLATAQFPYGNVFIEAKNFRARAITSRPLSGASDNELP